MSGDTDTDARRSTGAAFVVGEALVDVTVESDGVERRRPGGSPMNVAVGLARLGLPTRLLTSFGDDADGRLLADHLGFAGVVLDDGSVTAGGTTSTALARIGADGSATYEFDLQWDPPGGRTVPQGTALVHSGSIAAALEPGGTRVLQLFESVSDDVLRSFDPNVRAAITPDRGAVLERVEAFAGRSDVLKLSDEDAAWLFPARDAAAVAEWALALGVGLVVVTKGGAGCLVVTRRHRLALEAVPTQVVDTIGAGDAFMAALLAGLLRWDLAGQVRHGGIGADDLVRLASLAQRSASYTVARAGAQAPTWAEIA